MPLINHLISSLPRQDEFIFAKIQYLKVGGHEFNSRLEIPNQRVESSGFSRMVG